MKVFLYPRKSVQAQAFSGFEGHSLVHAQQKQIYHLDFPAVPSAQGMLPRG